MNKQEWRKHFKELRAAIPEDEHARIDAAITERVLALPAFTACDLLLPYLSFGAEIETRDIIRAAWTAGKTVVLPRCVPGTRDMKWYKVDSFDGLVLSSLGVEEPPEDPSYEIDPAQFVHALCLVPGLSFDAQGFRMGYGGGFYDSFLAGFSGTSVGLCRTAQLSDTVPALESHDLSVGIVVTEPSIIRC